MSLPRKNDDVQVLRGLAVAMVVSNHLVLLHYLLPDWAKHGHTGVQLFFVISGYVIAKSSMRMPLEGFTIAFLIKRFFRIVPIAGLWLFAYFAFFSFTGMSVRAQVWAIATFTYNFRIVELGSQLGHYWSLVVEEHFYFLYAFLYPMLSKRRLLVLAMLVLIAATCLYLRPHAGGTAFTQAALDYFALGIVIANLRTNFLAVAPRLILVFTAAILPVTIWVLFFFRWPNSYELLLIASGLLVLVASADRNIVLPIPYLRSFAIWCGARSYSIYLVHPLIIYVDAAVATHSPLYMSFGLVMRAVIVLTLSLVIANLSYEWLEMRFDKFGKLLAYQSQYRINKSILRAEPNHAVNDNASGKFEASGEAIILR